MPYKFWLLLLFLWSGHLMAQESLPLTVERITFEGLKRTQASFLRSLLKTEIGDFGTEQTIQADVQQLKNTPGIGNANYRIDTVDQKLHLTFLIDEVRTLLPIVNFGGIKGNFWFQLGFQDINWQGKGQQISTYYQNNDRRHAGQLFYQVPRFRGSDWGFAVNFTHWASREPLYFDQGAVNYDYDNTSWTLSILRHFGFTRTLELAGNYFIENYQKSELQFLENPPGPNSLRQPKALFKFEYRENHINFHFFYLKGLSWLFRSQHVYNSLDQSWFYSVQSQGR